MRNAAQPANKNWSMHSGETSLAEAEAHKMNALGMEHLKRTIANFTYTVKRRCNCYKLKSTSALTLPSPSCFS